MKNYLATLAMLATIGVANAGPQESIAALDERLAKIGAPRLEGTDKVGDKEVPAIFFGARKINNNYDVVDEIRKKTGASATVFVKQGDEFVRISTNVLTPEGKRGTGTLLARNKVYAAVIKGEKYCGEADVLGTAFDTCYHPIRDASNKVIGLTYVGHKK
jgi:Cache 3/Cache 2 fusion domain